MTDPETLEQLRELMLAATPGPYRAHDHNDMARLGENPEKWIGYAWVGRITKDSEPDGRFDAGWLDRDSRDDGSKEYRERASADAHFVAAALNALPDLLSEREHLLARVGELEAEKAEAGDHWRKFKGTFLQRNAGWPTDGIDAMQALNRLLPNSCGPLNTGEG